MTELCIDTSGATAVSIVRDGQVIGASRNESGRHHAESITPCVLEALEDAGLPADASHAGLDAVCVGTGPAPFTGLRAGLVSARVFAKAAGIPVYGVCSLDAIARLALDHLSPDNCTGVISWLKAPMTCVSSASSKSDLHALSGELFASNPGF